MLVDYKLPTKSIIVTETTLMSMAKKKKEIPQQNLFGK